MARVQVHPEGETAVKRSQFVVGNRVTWSSQAGGYVRRKTGYIIENVPPYQSPIQRIRGQGKPRDHESYIVRVDGKTEKAHPKFYWPVVSVLKRAKSSGGLESPIEHNATTN